MANRFSAMFVLFLLTCMSMIHIVHDDLNTLEELNSVEQTSKTTSSTDVPSWRIGDKWTYETQFDVAQLIAQANVSASLNTLTGDIKSPVFLKKCMKSCLESIEALKKYPIKVRALQDL